MPQEIVKRVAVNTRALREQTQLSLSELARRAGISKGALSQLEAGQANPTVETLWALAQAFGVPFSDLIAEPSPPDVVVTRAHDGEWITGTPISSRLVQRLSIPATIEVHEIRVEPGPERRSPAHPRGLTEHVILHAGRMRLGPVEHPVILEAGDAASYRADTAHLYEALEPGTAGLILMVYPETGTQRQLRTAHGHDE
jgi:transcriptional regulator with XRE-family HTH domain